jgi:hypothetical protein
VIFANHTAARDGTIGTKGRVSAFAAKIGRPVPPSPAEREARERELAAKRAKSKAARKARRR